MANNNPFQLFVTSVDSVGPLLKLWGQSDQTSMVFIERFLLQLTPEFEKGRYVPNLANLKVDQLCVGKYKDGVYYRAKIVDLTHVREGFIVVHFIDHGNTESLPLTSIRVVEGSSPLTSFVPLANEYILAGIVHVSQTWDETAFDMLTNMICNMELTAMPVTAVGSYKIIDIQYNNSDLSKLLINLNIAIPCSINTQIQILAQKINQPTFPPVSPNANRGPVMPQIARSDIKPFTSPRNSLISNSQAPVTESPTVFKNTILQIHSEHMVTVTAVDDGPKSFAVQLQAWEKYLNKLMMDLNTMTTAPLQEIPVPGTLCVARCSNSRVLCRAVITQVIEDNCKVYFVDFGNSEIIPYSDLFQLPANFTQQKILALRFSLANLKTLNVTPELKNAFKEFVMGKTLKLRVTPPEGPPVLQYGELYDDKGNNILNILKATLGLEILKFRPMEKQETDCIADVLVSYVKSCQEFYVHFLSEIDALKRLMADLNLHCTNSNQILPPSRIHVGMACCAYFPDDDQWYRAEVLNFAGNGYQVKYVDYGNEGFVQQDQVKDIPLELVNRLPVQAVRCCLIEHENVPFNLEISTTFENLALENKFTMKIIRYHTPQVLLVDLLDPATRVPITSTLKTQQSQAPTAEEVIPPSEETPKTFDNKRGQKQNWRETPPRFRKKENATGGSVSERLRRDVRPSDTTKRFDNESTKSSQDGSPPFQSETNRGRPQRGQFPSKERTNRNEWNKNRENRDDWGNKGRENKDDWGNKGRENRDDWGNKGRENRDDWGNKGRENRDDWGNKGRENRDDWGNKGRENRDDWRSKGRENRDEWGKGRENRESRSEKPAFRSKSSWSESKKENTDGWGGDTSPRWNDSNVGDSKPRFNSRKFGSPVNKFEDRKKDDFKSENKSNWGNKSFSPKKDFKFRRSGSVSDGYSSDRSNKSSDQSFRKKKLFMSSAVSSLPAPDYANLGDKFKELDLPEGTIENVLISWFYNPKHFYVQVTSHETEFKKMMRDIQKAYKKRPPVQNIIPVGSSVIALFNEDNFLYRATVLDVRLTKYKVRYVDYGNTNYVEKNKIWQVEKQFMELPIQAVVCTLPNIYPAGETWNDSPEMDSCFNKGNYQCVFHGFEDSKRVVNLSHNGLLVVDDLINKGLATRDPSVATNEERTPEMNISQQIPGIEHNIEDAPVDLGLLLEQTIRIHISCAYGLDRFFIYLDKEKATEVLNEINSVAEKTQLEPLSADQVVNGTVCLLQTNSGWQRCIITNSAATNGIYVEFPDVGGGEEVPLEKLYALPLELTGYYYQSMECCLHNYMLGCTQNLSDEEFQSKYEGTDLIAYIHDIRNGRLVLTLYDLSGTKLDLIKAEDDSEDYSQISPLCPMPILSGNMKVWVSHINSPDSLYIQRSVDTDQLSDLLNQLYEKYETSTKDENKEIVVNQIYAVKSQDGQWYRGKVLQVHDNQIDVLYIDYGNQEMISTDSIRTLDESFNTPHELALHVALPVSTSSNITEQLQDLTVDKEFYSKLGYTEGCWYIELYNESIALSQHLIDSKLANKLDFDPFRRRTEVMGMVDNKTPDDEKILLFITHADSPNEFYAQLASDETSVNALQAELENSLPELTPLESPDIGVLCAAKYSADGIWYRAEVLDADDQITTVRFIDYGNTDVLDNTSEDIKTLPAHMLTIDRYAKMCSLDIAPVGEEWNQTASELFEEKVVGQVCQARILYQDEKGTLYLDININGENIAESLIAEGYAKPLIRNVDEEVSSKTGFVSHINSLNEFWIQLESSCADLEMVSDQLSIADAFPDLTDKRPGVLCAARFPDDNDWYRARILTVSNDEIQVLFIDYGNSSPTTELKMLPEQVINIRALALKCALSKPADLEEWPEEAVEKFRELAADGATVFEIKVLATGETSVVELSIDNVNIINQLLPDQVPPQQQLPQPKALISHFDSLSSFWIQLDKDTTTLESITNILLNTENLTELTSEPKENTIYVALFPEDECWYRATVTLNDDGYTAFFIDFGNSAHTTELRECPPEISSIPPLARHCSLKLPENYENWPDSATENFVNNIVNNEVQFEIKFWDDSDPSTVSIILNGQDIVADLLGSNTTSSETSEPVLAQETKKFQSELEKVHDEEENILGASENAQQLPSGDEPNSDSTITEENIENTAEFQQSLSEDVENTVEIQQPLSTDEPQNNLAITEEDIESTVQVQQPLSSDGQKDNSKVTEEDVESTVEIQQSLSGSELGNTEQTTEETSEENLNETEISINIIEEIKFATEIQISDNIEPKIESSEEQKSNIQEQSEDSLSAAENTQNIENKETNLNKSISENNLIGTSDTSTETIKSPSITDDIKDNESTNENRTSNETNVDKSDNEKTTEGSIDNKTVTDQIKNKEIDSSDEIDNTKESVNVTKDSDNSDYSSDVKESQNEESENDQFEECNNGILNGTGSTIVTETKLS